MKIIFGVFHGDIECGAHLQRPFFKRDSAQKHLDLLGSEKQKDGEETINEGDVLDDMKDYYTWERKEDGSWSDEGGSEILFIKNIEVYD